MAIPRETLVSKAWHCSFCIPKQLYPDGAFHDSLTVFADEA